VAYVNILSLQGMKKATKNLMRIACSTDKIRTAHFPNTILE